MEIIKSKTNLTDMQIKELEERILQKYDYVYDLFEATARKGIEPAQNLELSDEIAKAIEEESKKIQIPHVEIRGIFEISIKNPDGIEIIKSLLSSVESNKNSSHVAISYIAAPRYRVVITTENFKTAEKVMNNVVDKVRSSTVK